MIDTNRARIKSQRRNMDCCCNTCIHVNMGFSVYDRYYKCQPRVAAVGIIHVWYVYDNDTHKANLALYTCRECYEVFGM